MRPSLDDVRPSAPSERDASVRIGAVACAASDLVRAMSRGDFYPSAPGLVEVRQTHASWVFLAGDRVYKVKKPVRFPFLDFSTLDRRLHFCREEVRLNRRLSSAYLGVAAIEAENGGFALVEDFEAAAGQVVEVAVRMRRLPEELMLDHLLESGRASEGAVHALAEKLVLFERSAVTARAAELGSAEAVRNLVAGNLDEAAAFVGESLSRADHAALRTYALDFIENRRALFDERVREGRIREGHGDLRCEHVCMTEEIDVFDCVEFSEELRTADVASEIAFLAMDLDSLGASLAGDELVSTFRRATHDGSLGELCPFYQCYRAVVRGKVESLKAREAEVAAEERREALERARRAFRLARRYARGRFAPALVVVCGLPGTGKSTLAAAVGEATGYVVVSSDVTRKRLAGLTPTEPTPADERAAIYGETFTRLTYRKLIGEAERCLRAGKGAVLDATFRSAEERGKVRRLAASVGMPIAFVECRADGGEVRRRMELRARHPERVSEANWNTYLEVRDSFEPLREIPEGAYLVHEASEDPEVLLRRLEPLIDGRNG